MGRRKKSGKPVERPRNDNKCERSENRCSNDWTNGGEKKWKTSAFSKLLDIYGRLELPLLKLDDNNMLTDSDDEETLEFEIRPRFVFSCGMCLVCMSTSERELLCEKCKMVSYCKAEHLNENRSSHAALCDAMCREFGGADGFGAAMRNAGPEIYRSYRIKLIETVEAKIARALDLWEREIILYPRVCRTCRRIGRELKRCGDCMVDFYCENHASEHAKWCKDFQVYRRILRMQHAHGYARPNFPDIARKSRCYSLESLNFDKLLLDMFDYNVNYRRIDAHTYASMSLSATAPLTALFALQKTRDDWTTRECLRIDVVGAEFQFECSSLRVWEKLFVHFLPRLKKLELEFTGPELRLPGAPIELLSRVVPCKRCKHDKRSVVVRFNEGKLYHEIPESASDPPADLICLFNPGLYRETGYDGSDTWPRTIQRFCRAKVPVVVTSYTEIEIPRDIERIQSIANVEIILEPQKNPFASIKPDRNFVSDDIVPLMYKNYCVSVVKGL